MSNPRETVKLKRRRTSNRTMDLSQRNQENEENQEMPADAASCRTCQLVAGAAVALATVVTVTGLLLSLLCVTRTLKPEVDEAWNSPGRELMERLHHCQRETQHLNQMLHTVTRDSRCRVCPDRWMWWRSHCYFYSVGLEDNLQWSQSAEFCQRRNGSLVVIQDSAEMEFIEGVMKTFPVFPFLWVGLTDSEREGQWLWSDGTHIQNHMTLTVDWDADHRDCADLRADGSLFASDCEAFGPWVCEKPW